jgi:glycosyltransferase involved in cell wall biosynthesis
MNRSSTPEPPQSNRARGSPDHPAGVRFPMRIAQIAPLAESVPPARYGGTERVVSFLTEELVALGHEVTLFASGDSRTDAVLVSPCPRALRLSRRPRPDANLAHAALLDQVAEAANNFDILHFHTEWCHLPLVRRLNVPFLTTLHGRLDQLGIPLADEQFADCSFVSISNDQRSSWPLANWLGTVYHGLPRDLFLPSLENDGYLAFLGRMSPEKGPEIAIRVARAAGLPLRIAAKIPRSDRAYFERSVRPAMDGDSVQFLGELDESRKRDFLGRAAALLFPIDWPEPFGLVMIEAMACGTPVIAFGRGSVPEVIEDGVTGFIVKDENAALAAVKRLAVLDRQRVRKEFERRFAVSVMAQQYLALYRTLFASPRSLVTIHANE